MIIHLYKQFQKNQNQSLDPLRFHLRQYSNPLQSEFVHAAIESCCSRQLNELVDVALRASTYLSATLVSSGNAHSSFAMERRIWREPSDRHSSVGAAHYSRTHLVPNLIDSQSSMFLDAY